MKKSCTKILIFFLFGCFSIYLTGYGVSGKVFSKANYTYSTGTSVCNYNSQYFNVLPFRWISLPVTVYVGNVPNEHKDIVIGSINYWKNYFPFEISNNPNSDVNIIWVNDLSGTSNQFQNPYATTRHIFDENGHKCILKVRSRKFCKTELNEIMLHELGHVVGLDESTNPNDIMYQIPKAKDSRIGSWTIMTVGYIPLIIPTGYESGVAGKSSLSQRDLNTLHRIYNEQSINNTYPVNNIKQVPPVTIISQQDLVADYVNEGCTFHHYHNYDKAIESYKKALTINPNHPVANENIGACYKATGNYDLAIEYLNKSIVINPNNDNTYNNLGLSFEKKGLYNDAINNFKRAILINPNFYSPYVNLGSTYINIREYELAKENCQMAINLNPNNDTAYINLGVVYQNQGEYDKAIGLYKKAKF